ncbi:hypothetical protein PABG_00689 [Paracoccidioides brasiliensis Pb03]|nr:hypothetical protein PABG_00689 [Paracoccidioides brasiliensis Pb03]
MFVPQLYSYRNHFHKRAENDQAEDSPSRKIFIVVSIALLGVIIVCLSLYYGLRTLRFRNSDPKFIPTKYLKKKWRNWLPKTTYGHVPNAIPATRQAGANWSGNTAYTGAGDLSLDRRTSIQSVMTLPSYSPIPKPTEQVVGREGERGGMDVVMEFPETADEEEARREEEMESLYQIRLARRQEVAERERRRLERREARERGDWARLEEIQRQSRARNLEENQSDNGSNTSISAAALIAEHQSRGREKRVARVTYADVGDVRHDGTRLRASSQESDSRPLLDAASSMGSDGSTSLPRSAEGHQRATSGSSLFLNPTNQSDHDTPRGSITPAETDIGNSNIANPPQYDQLDWGEAPPYQSPVAGRGQGPQPPEITAVPSIEIEIPTPGNSAPVTPVSSMPRQL